MENPLFRAGGEEFVTVKQYVYKRIQFHLNNAINLPETLLENGDRFYRLRQAGERNRAILDRQVFPRRSGREHVFQLLLWHLLRALFYDEWEWLAEKDREHDLKYLTDLLIAGFEAPHTFTGFFSQELAFSSLNHEQLVYDLIGRVVTGNLDVEGAAFLLPLFVEEWEKLYNELQTLSHANRFMGRDLTDRLEEATRFRMTTYSYFVALLHVLSETTYQVERASSTNRAKCGWLDRPQKGRPQRSASEPSNRRTRIHSQRFRSPAFDRCPPRRGAPRPAFPGSTRCPHFHAPIH